MIYAFNKTVICIAQGTQRAQRLLPYVIAGTIGAVQWRTSGLLLRNGKPREIPRYGYQCKWNEIRVRGVWAQRNAACIVGNIQRTALTQDKKYLRTLFVCAQVFEIFLPKVNITLPLHSKVVLLQESSVGNRSSAQQQYMHIQSIQTMSPMILPGRVLCTMGDNGMRCGASQQGGSPPQIYWQISPR